MLRVLTAILFLTAFTLPAQTGPAGVGSSANNALWLKADAGTSSSTNNTAISFWNDQSGNGINVAQAVAVQQPSFATNVMNGFPAILFDNTNSSNQNDKLIGPDSPLLDNTNGYSFFTVSRPANLNGEARVLLSKRTTISIDQSFMLFYYSSNRLHVDIQTTNDRFNSNTTFSNNVNFIIDLFYNGTLSSSSRCALYIGETFDKNASETSTMVPDNSSPIVIGSTDATDPRPFGGHIAEIILYRQALGTAQRIILNNYLSAKYNIALSANDKYTGDNPSNGDYDREVAGIGQENSNANSSFSASVSGGLSISANSGLDNGDYVMAGHAVATNTSITTDVGGITGLYPARWQRVWYVDVTNASTTINANIEFDLSDGGMPAAVPGTVSNYVLLYRVGQTGNWTELAAASSVSGDKILFNNINLVNDGYYTIGTRNLLPSPLPVELLFFTATSNNGCVHLKWSTAIETDHESFTVQRSKDGEHYEDIKLIPGKANSFSIKKYEEVDLFPFQGISYYRLKQKDQSGEVCYSAVVAVEIDPMGSLIQIFPNPAEDRLCVNFGEEEFPSIHASVVDVNGKLLFSARLFPEHGSPDFIIDTRSLPKGTYILDITANNRQYKRKFAVK